MKRILIFSERTFVSAPRIIREIDALKEDYLLFLAGMNQTENLENYSSIYSFLSYTDRFINRFRKIFKMSRIYRFSKLRNFILKEKIDLVILHEPIFLPLFSKLKKKQVFNLVFNAHEYHPLEFEDVEGWLETEGQAFFSIYKNYLQHVDLLINVCEGIREKCLDEFVCDSIVVPNAAAHRSIQPKYNYSFPIKMVHHGVNIPSRKIENMIHVANELGSNYTLDLMLTKNKSCESYDKKILDLIQKTQNVKWIEPVPFDSICNVLNNYDIGLFYLEPTSFNYLHALPNKLFEFIQGRLAIAISPSPEMVRIVKKYNLGVHSESFSIIELVEKIKALTFEDIQSFKQNANSAAEIENAKQYKEVFKSKINELLNIK